MEENQTNEEIVNTFDEELAALREENARITADNEALRAQNTRILKEYRRSSVPKAGEEEHADEYAFLDILKIKN